MRVSPVWPEEQNSIKEWLNVCNLILPAFWEYPQQTSIFLEHSNHKIHILYLYVSSQYPIQWFVLNSFFKNYSFNHREQIQGLRICHNPYEVYP